MLRTECSTQNKDENFADWLQPPEIVFLPDPALPLPPFDKRRVVLLVNEEPEKGLRKNFPTSLCQSLHQFFCPKKNLPKSESASQDAKNKPKSS